MSDTPGTAGGQRPGEADVDPGEPVAELRSLTEEPSNRFVPNVVAGIHRRQTIAQAIEVSWWGVTDMLMEFVQALLQTLGVREETDRED